MKLNNNKRNSLLGIPDRGGRDSSAHLAQLQNEKLLEEDQNRSLDLLASKVFQIRTIAQDLEEGISLGNRIAGDLDSEMGGVQGMLKGTMGKLTTLSQQGGSRHMCYLILFIIFVFLLLYFIITKSSSSSTATDS